MGNKLTDFKEIDYFFCIRSPCVGRMMNRSNQSETMITFVKTVQMNGCVRLTGAQQNTYRARSGSVIWSIILESSVKSCVRHMKYKSSFTTLSELKIS